jgi:hypothetical protein
MISLIASLVLAVYGVWYAKDPMRILRRKYGSDEVPQTSIKAARVIGVVLVVIGVASFLYNAVGLLCAG